MRPFKTLIVEDHDTFRQALLEAATSQEVFPQVETFAPDLIFMDIKIPGENGLSLTQKIKARHPETLVIVLTGYDIPEYRQAAYERGANDFLVKGSITNEEILNLVASVLNANGFDSQGSK